MSDLAQKRSILEPFLGLKKYNIMHEGKHSERSVANNDLYVPEKPRKKCNTCFIV